MPLPWIRLDTQLPSNPKILELIEAKKYQAVAVYPFSLAYSGAHGTDGYIPRVALGQIHATPRVASDLVAVKLWAPDAKGWFIPDWADFQQASAKTADVRAAQHVGAMKGNCVRWHGADCQCWRGIG